MSPHPLAAPRMRPRLPVLLLAALLLAPSLGPALAALVPEDLEPPVLSKPVPRGGVAFTGAAAGGPLAPKVVDGQVGDWRGTSTLLGGTLAYSAGELVYQDYLFDDLGADDGKDAQRGAMLESLEAQEPRARRLEATSQGLGEEFDLHEADPTGGVVFGQEAYGDAAYPSGAGGHADLLEVRVAADAAQLWLLARIVTMTDAAQPALLVLLDTEERGEAREVPFGSGLTTERAEWALLVAAAGVWAADLRSGAVSQMPDAEVAVNPQGYLNAIEAAVPRAAFTGHAEPTLGLALGAGIADGAGGLRKVATGDAKGQLLNVAFRSEQRVSVRMERSQAFALHAGSIDEFLYPMRLDWLEGGASVPWQPTPGWHERVFLSAERLSREQGRDGIFQHYGLYLPSNWKPEGEFPVTWWLIWRGGNAHAHAAWAPRLVEQMAEEMGAMMVSPRARGSSTWFVGLGHADFLEAWDDAHRWLRVDEDREYLAGYSMGGFASYLLGMLYPDRFAAAMPVNGPLTQGLWLGLFEDGRDALSGVNGGDPNAELTYRLIENARNLPYAIYQGGNDQLVPVTSALRAAARFAELGQQYRLYVFPGHEHYALVILDEWKDGAQYLAQHVRDPNPATVVYKRVPALERAVETIQSKGIALDFAFGGAYWLSGLEVRKADPGDPQNFGLANVTSLGIPEHHGVLPEAGAGLPGHTTPAVMHGLRWVPDGAGPAVNGFTARLVNAATVQLDLARMGIATAQPIQASLDTDGPSELRLAGSWPAPPTVLVDGQPAQFTLEGGVLALPLAAGQHVVNIAP